jgi:hypothetical protein
MQPEIKINWQDKAGKWHPFDLGDINHMPRNHALRLFSNSTPVVAKEGDQYITNSQTIYDQYRQSNKPVRMFSDIHPSEKKLAICGFLGE